MTNSTSTQAATTVYVPCKCSTGCPATTRNIFSQGHDARMVSRLVKQVVATEGEFAGTAYNISDARLELHQRGGTHALQAKLDAAVAKAHDVWLARQDREAARAAKKAAKAGGAPVVTEVASEPIVEVIEVVSAKVGRWTYRGTVTDGEFTYENKKGEAVTTTRFALV
jgi:hypothetical protein